MDYRSLITPALAILPESAINLHATRSATERQAQADLIGGGTDGWFDLDIFLNVDLGAGDDDEWTVILRRHGDQRALHPAGSTCVISEGGTPRSWTATRHITNFSPSTAFGVCLIARDTPDGYSTHGYQVNDIEDETALDTSDVTVQFNTAGGDPILTATAGSACFEDSIGPAMRWTWFRDAL